MRKILIAIVAVAAMVAFADVPTITGVKAQQRYPWNALIDIDYTITGDTTGLNLSFSVTDAQNGKTYKPATFLSPPSAAEGTHRATWSPKDDGLSIISTNIVVSVLLTRTVVPPDPPVQAGEYLVIDLSGGTAAASYPVTTLDAVPSSGWTDEYKTTKLVLCKINAGTFTMGCETNEVGYYGYEAVPHEVTISKPFYMGVFEVTQRQWELVMGTKPSYFTNATCYATRPVERVSYNMVRGSSDGARWPETNSVDETSFMGILRQKSGLDSIDLPTEAQWEYACRAGTATALNSGKNLTNITNDYNMSEVGRYRYNGGYIDGSSSPSRDCTTENGTAKVGSYQPNAWGLYDMHGNVWEWTLDWWQGRSSFTAEPVSDPVGSASGSDRVLRGGCWGDYARNCRSANRSRYTPSYGNGYFGFRVCCSAGQDRDKVQLWANGPYWATTNIGAEKPEDYGYYFWWGDTNGYKRVNDAWVASDGSSSNFSFEEGNTPTYNKDIATLQGEGWITAGGVLAPSHDAAHVHWGGNWRMPTKQELDDLVSNCDWAWATNNNVTGYVVRGKGDYASASVFLPATGNGYGTSLSNAGSYGHFWSSVPYSDYYYSAWYLYFNSRYHTTSSNYRYYGHSVRPVQGFTE